MQRLKTALMDRVPERKAADMDLEKELYRKLSRQEYEIAADELDDAIYWANKGREQDTDDYDNRVHDFLLCAAKKLKDAGEDRAANICMNCARFF